MSRELPLIRGRLVSGVVLAFCVAVASTSLAQETPASPAGSTETQPDPLSDDALFASAEARIEQHRKAEAAILVVDASGVPMPRVKVRVEQTRHGFLFGCNIFEWGNMPDEATEDAYRRQFAQLLNYATLGFYWSSYEPERGKPNHERAEAVARWCRQQGIATKGHPLAWNSADPAWLPDDLDEIRRLQMTRIEDCVSRFTGLIDRWDVVNEITQYDRADFVERRAPKLSAAWKNAGQIEFARECFEIAQKAGPKATLLVNDYRTGEDFEQVVDKLVDAQGNRLIDAIGIQSHMHGGAWSNRQIWDVCQRFARFGVPLHFTETTIVSGKRVEAGPDGEAAWPTTPEGEAVQAREAVRFYTMLFSHPSVEAITWWDFSDYNAWQGAPAGFLRADMTPKPVYDELMKLIKGQWWTRTTLDTTADGIATFRGFLGGYRLTVTGDDGQTVSADFTLSGKEKNRWVIEVK